MRLQVRRTGGFAGLVQESPVLDTAALPPEEAEELHSLVEEAALDDIGAPGRAGGPDRFAYELTVEDRRLTLSETDMTPARRALVQRLQNAPRD
jgi:hypothetical protein